MCSICCSQFHCIPVSGFNGLQKPDQVGMLQALHDFYLSRQELLQIISGSAELTHYLYGDISFMPLAVRNLIINESEHDLFHSSWHSHQVRHLPELSHRSRSRWCCPGNTHATRAPWASCPWLVQFRHWHHVGERWSSGAGCWQELTLCSWAKFILFSAWFCSTWDLSVGWRFWEKQVIGGCWDGLQKL